jgi:hypothetical protein
MKTLAMLKLLRFLVGPPALHLADEPQRIECEQTLEMQPCKGKRRNTVADVNLHTGRPELTGNSTPIESNISPRKESRFLYRLSK